MQYNIPVKVIILNNNFLGMVRQWQHLFFEKRYASTELVNPDFVAIAKAFKIDAKKIVKREDLESALTAMLNAPGPYVLEIKVEKQENVFPMIAPGAGVGEIRLD
jgi:acetolactate synthase-1/2/3 large subunit